MPTRRTFLVSALAGPALGCASRLTAAENKTTVVDTHLHCFAGKDEARFPYHKDGPYQPDAATPEHLLKLMKDAGVDFAVVVHPEPYQDDHRYLEHCLAIGKEKLKGTVLFFAGRPGNDAKMRALVKKWPIVAARIHAYSPERLPPFGKPELRDLWKLAGDLGLAVQLHLEPRFAPGFEPLIKEFKTVRVLIDHLGRPFQGTPKEHAVVVGWSKYDNVVMKLSAVPEKGKYPHRDPAVSVKELADAYGADRLMYGGGYDAKATPASYRGERERIAAMLGHLSAADRAKVFGGTAVRLMGFKS